MIKTIHKKIDSHLIPPYVNGKVHTLFFIDENMLDYDEKIHHATNIKVDLTKNGEMMQLTDRLYASPQMEVYDILSNIIQLQPPCICAYMCI